MDKFIILNILIGLSFVNGFYIHQQNENRNKRDLAEDHVKFGNILNYWNNFKNKLNGIESSDNYEIEKETFNELEMLQMIPMIIENYRLNKITQYDIKNLSEIYGNLWSIIEEEAKRKKDENSINPLLKTLFDSFYLTKDITNDIDHNTVTEIKRKSSTSSSSPSSSKQSSLMKKLFSNINKSEHPSQRLLNVAAMLIHQAMHQGKTQEIKRKQSLFTGGLSASTFGMKKRPYKISLSNTPTSSRRRATLNLQLTDIPIKKITRTKRNVNIHFSGNDHDHQDTFLNPKFDAMLKIFKDQNMNGIEGNYDNNYEDEDGNEDYDYSDEHNFGRIENNNYSHNDFYEDDDSFIDEINGSHSDGNRNNDDDADYGSFQDLMLLAEKNRLRREMEEGRLKRNHDRNFITAASSSSSSQSS